MRNLQKISNEQKRKRLSLPDRQTGMGRHPKPRHILWQRMHDPHRAGPGGSSPATISCFVCDDLFAGAYVFNCDELAQEQGAGCRKARRKLFTSHNFYNFKQQKRLCRDILPYIIFFNQLINFLQTRLHSTFNLCPSSVKS